MEILKKILTTFFFFFTHPQKLKIHFRMSTTTTDTLEWEEELKGSPIMPCTNVAIIQGLIDERWDVSDNRSGAVRRKRLKLLSRSGKLMREIIMGNLHLKGESVVIQTNNPKSPNHYGGKSWTATVTSKVLFAFEGGGNCFLARMPQILLPNNKILLPSDKSGFGYGDLILSLSSDNLNVVYSEEFTLFGGPFVRVKADDTVYTVKLSEIVNINWE